MKEGNPRIIELDLTLNCSALRGIGELKMMLFKYEHFNGIAGCLDEKNSIYTKSKNQVISGSSPLVCMINFNKNEDWPESLFYKAPMWHSY